MGPAIKSGMINIFIFCLLLSACSSNSTVYAPVTEIGMIEPVPQTGIHRVAKGETLYGVAWRYGLDYRYLAVRNQISPPYAIQVGQVIYLRGHRSISSTAVPTIATSLVAMKSGSRADTSQVRFRWPATGAVMTAFSSSHKGINIAGRLGDPVYAAAAGRVVYCGDGLRGYGNLIIVKHNSLYLSAYAHNRTLYVKEGEWVRQGQKIAEMGGRNGDYIMLHFEIRRAGKPINPLSLLRS